MSILEIIKENYISQEKSDFVTTLFGENKELLKTNEEVIVYGAGSGGREVSECLLLHGVTTEFFCDSNPDLIGKTLLGKPIISFEQLFKSYKDRFIVVGVQKPKKIVYESLVSKGFNRVGIIQNDEQFYYYLQFPRWKIEILELTPHANKISQVYEMLADQKSKDIFINRLSTLTSYADFASYKNYCKLSNYPSAYPESKKIFSANFENQMYFDNDLITLKPGEVNLVDCGAYDGDSFIEFQKSLEKLQIKDSFVYCFEPDLLNFQKLRTNLSGYKNVDFFQLGVWNEKTTLKFASSNLMYQTESCVVRTEERLSKVIQATESDSSIEVDSIDNLLYPNRVNIIKMDVEGSESEALLGAQKTIKKHHPQLIISTYHKKDDLWNLPLLIKNMSPDYKFYIRHFSFSWSETVLIAIPK
jgi:FkbM family methyltransferase